VPRRLATASGVTVKGVKSRYPAPHEGRRERPWRRAAAAI